MFNVKRLSLAKMRRRLTGKGLAERAGVSAITVSRIEKGDNEPNQETIEKLAHALAYPVDFFFGDEINAIEERAVSFRSLSKMSARERHAAIAAGVLGLEMNDWIERQFYLPEVNLPDLSNETKPEAAAQHLREHWALGERPISSMIGLLETQGVRVFSLSEHTASVDAFSFWRDNQPFIFLNTFKTPERGIFDSAHELGHLIMHRHAGPRLSHAGPRLSKDAEREADAFASSFLMPAQDVRSCLFHQITAEKIIHAKKQWRVSAMALAYRLHHLRLITEWQYKSICIELTRRGYRSGEPSGIEQETSLVWKKILEQLWSEGKTKADIAEELDIPLDEIEGLIWGLAGPSPKPIRSNAKPKLRAVD